MNLPPENIFLFENISGSEVGIADPNCGEKMANRQVFMDILWNLECYLPLIKHFVSNVRL